MDPIVGDRLEEVAALCRAANIRRLDLFGSAALGTVDPETSDLDYVVDLGEYEPGVAMRYLRFAEALGTLFGRAVDLGTVPSIKDPTFKAEVDRTSRRIFGEQ
ncbi:MAG: hypothetical protein AVDCRST_MAG70-1079 [uncultured Thermomicrobiales bacterium]|uniref:Polymerase nucleotidyl transferase domain-containing protein n=1 Tax=uncultured Thermomicrobiales bacterium TaxID=1645740 RepID=A0A6J4ULV9_9BACT|nr:MAG: hypothetical protein AVDCRST_MAG70-1079 [uncultured Thermomicrobiales bacterium]